MSMRMRNDIRYKEEIQEREDSRKQNKAAWPRGEKAKRLTCQLGRAAQGIRNKEERATEEEADRLNAG